MSASDPPTSVPPTSETPSIPTASTAVTAVPTNTSVLEKLEEQKKSYLFNIDEPISISSSSLLLLLGQRLRGEENYQDWKASILNITNSKGIRRHLYTVNRVPKRDQ